MSVRWRFLSVYASPLSDVLHLEFASITPILELPLDLDPESEHDIVEVLAYVSWELERNQKCTAYPVQVRAEEDQVHDQQRDLLVLFTGHSEVVQNDDEVEEIENCTEPGKEDIRFEEVLEVFHCADEVAFHSVFDQSMDVLKRQSALFFLKVQHFDELETSREALVEDET